MELGVSLVWTTDGTDGFLFKLFPHFFISAPFFYKALFGERMALMVSCGQKPFLLTKVIHTTPGLFSPGWGFKQPRN